MEKPKPKRRRSLLGRPLSHLKYSKDVGGGWSKYLPYGYDPNEEKLKKKK